MSAKRKRHPAEFKARVALEAVKGLKTTTELAREFKIHPVQISQWKRELIERLPTLFASAAARAEASPETLTAPLYEEIGRLKVELDWLKKSARKLNGG